MLLSEVLWCDTRLRALVVYTVRNHIGIKMNLSQNTIETRFGASSVGNCSHPEWSLLFSGKGSLVAYLLYELVGFERRSCRLCLANLPLSAS